MQEDFIILDFTLAGWGMSTTIKEVEHSPMGALFTNNIESSGCGIRELHVVFI